MTAKKEKDGSGTLNTTYEHQVTKKVIVTGGGSINTNGKWEVTAGIKLKIGK